jgi:hypothetical protein
VAIRARLKEFVRSWVDKTSYRAGFGAHVFLGMREWDAVFLAEIAQATSAHVCQQNNKRKVLQSRPEKRHACRVMMNGGIELGTVRENSGHLPCANLRKDGSPETCSYGTRDWLIGCGFTRFRNFGGTSSQHVNVPNQASSRIRCPRSGGSPAQRAIAQKTLLL